MIILLHEIGDNFCTGHYILLLWHSTTEFCHKLLHYSYYSQHTIVSTLLYSSCSLGTGHTENTAFLLLHACMLRPLRNNCRCLQSHYLATGLHATVLTKSNLLIVTTMFIVSYLPVLDRPHEFHRCNNCFSTIHPRICGIPRDIVDSHVFGNVHCVSLQHILCYICKKYSRSCWTFPC
jgi:hypothetical protein